MMPDQLQRLIDYLVDVAGHFFGLPLVREVEQAIVDRLAPERFVANDFKVFVKILVQLLVVDLAESRSERFSARCYSCQWIVQFMDYSSRQPANRGELLGVNDCVVHFLLLGDVFSHGNHMSHLGVVDPHGYFANPPVLLHALYPRFLFLVDDFSGTKDLQELLFERIPGLPREYIEHIAAEDFAAAHAAPSDFPVPVPGDYFHVAIDYIQRDRERVDDLFCESLLFFDLARPVADFDRKVDRSVFGPLE